MRIEQVPSDEAIKRITDDTLFIMRRVDVRHFEIVNIADLPLKQTLSMLKSDKNMVVELYENYED